MAIVVAVWMAIAGVPASVIAAEHPVASVPGLHFNGRPLGQLAFDGGFAGGAARGVQTPEADGQIRGVAIGTDGRPLSDWTVTLRLVSERSVVATVTTATNGGFAFTALPAGRYVVEALVEPLVVATSGTVRLSEHGITFTRLMPPGAIPSTVDKGHGGLFWTAVGAGIGAGLGMLAYTGSDCRSPDSLCPIAPVMGAISGATFGLLFGIGR